MQVADASHRRKHYLHAPSNSECAYTEGFADFISVATSPVDNEFSAAAESDGFKPQCQPNYFCEAVFASMLLDLIDPVNVADPDGYADVVELPARHVLDLFGSCLLSYEQRTFRGGVWANSFADVPRSTPHATDCMLNNGPRLIGTIPGYQVWWLSRTLPWPTLTGTTLANVSARMNRL